jgi:hypothetical protein
MNQYKDMNESRDLIDQSGVGGLIRSLSTIVGLM